MTTDVAAVREELDHASDVADGERRRQVNSIEEGLMELLKATKSRVRAAVPDPIN